MSMIAEKKCIVPRPLKERLEELKAKLELLESERTAYYESSYITLQTNRDKIASLRRELHDLRLALTEKNNKDEAIISQAFQNRPVEKSAFSAKTCENALQEVDFRVSAAMKRYNYSKYVTFVKEQKLRQLQKDLVEAQAVKVREAADEKKKNSQMQTIRNLENRVAKLELKGNESEFIQRTYEAIFKRLYDEHVLCNKTLDEMELDILRCRNEQVGLIETNQEAQVLRGNTEKNLHDHEQFELADRKRREIEKERMRRVMDEEKKKSVERSERTKAQQDNNFPSQSLDIDPIDVPSSSEEKPPMEPDELEENLEKLRTVTGLVDITSVVHKFESQLVVKENLVDLINEMEHHIQLLRQDCAAKREQLVATQSTREKENERVQEQISCISNKFHTNIHENEETAEKYDSVSLFFAETKAGLETVLEKLMLMKLTDGSKPVFMKPGTIEEHVKETFEHIKLRVASLVNQLKSTDIASYKEKMSIEERVIMLQMDEIATDLKQKLPIHNDRVRKFPDSKSEEGYASGPDDPTFKNRLMVKQESSQFIEMRLKKRSRKRKHRK